MDKEHPEVIECDTDSDPEEFSDAVEKPTDECEDPADKFFDVDWKESKEGESAEDDDKSTNTPSAQDLAEQRLKERMEIEEKMTENEKQAKKSEAVELKKSGNELYLAGENLEAIKKYDQALETCPLLYKEDRAILLANKAAASIKMGQKEKAIEECSEALALHPTYVKALLRRGQSYEETDKPHEAMKDFEKVLEIDPGHKEARMAVMRLPEKIREKDEKLKAEMLDNLKKLGNMVLKPFGLSTENFNMVQDPNTGGYNIQFNK